MQILSNIDAKPKYKTRKRKQKRRKKRPREFKKGGTKRKEIKQKKKIEEERKQKQRNAPLLRSTSLPPSTAIFLPPLTSTNGKATTHLQVATNQTKPSRFRRHKTQQRRRRFLGLQLAAHSFSLIGRKQPLWAAKMGINTPLRFENQIMQEFPQNFE